MEFDFDAIEDEDSPFPEVRASVSNVDDPDMPAMTIRMWFVGLLLCMISRSVCSLPLFFQVRDDESRSPPVLLMSFSTFASRHPQLFLLSFCLYLIRLVNCSHSAYQSLCIGYPFLISPCGWSLRIRSSRFFALSHTHPPSSFPSIPDLGTSRNTCWFTSWLMLPSTVHTH